MMWKMLLSGFAVLAVTGASFGQATSDGTRQVVGLFTSTCLSFADDPKAIRDLMKQHHVPELNDQGRAIFLRDHVGVGFDATNMVTRLALVSEDSGVCSAFAGQANASEIGPMLAATTKARGLDLVQTSGKETTSATSSFYKIKVKDHLYRLVVSSNPIPNASVQAAITLAP
ncbi:MAG: hypothetical protein ABI150_15135 [Nitrobacter sp.]